MFNSIQKRKPIPTEMFIRRIILLPAAESRNLSHGIVKELPHRWEYCWECCSSECCLDWKNMPWITDTQATAATCVAV